MVSAIASLVLYLWDVDGGLTSINKYLYTSDENVKAGALLAWEWLTAECATV